MEMNKNKLLRAVGLKLKVLREQWRYERKKMADYLGITRVGYSNNEKGVSFPGIKTLFLLAEEHDISMDWLIFNKGPMNFKEKEKMKTMENELAKEREVVGKLRVEKERLEKELEAKNAVMDMTPEMKELMEYMKQIPFLYHEVLAGFQEFKWEKKELIEAAMEKERD
ncbi:MAG: helix-turn-helix transcriptional regulator [bacterium]|nr:helix-turn-helix transcriptional regulator [bacterium]